jgi:hypothetical protein
MQAIFIPLTQTLNLTRLAPENFQTHSFLLATAAVGGSAAQRWCIRVCGSRMYLRMGWLPMRWYIRLPFLPCSAFAGRLPVRLVCLLVKNIKVLSFRWMDAWIDE